MGLIVLPKPLVAHTDAVAADVMADLNAIISAVNGSLSLENLSAALRQQLAEPGDIKATGRAAAPTGWLMCEGQAVSRTTYAALFAAIGTAYGAGDGKTTFNVPDFRGRVPVGVDAGAGRLTVNNARGNAGGEQNHTLSEAEMPVHSHALNLNTGAESALHYHQETFAYDNSFAGGGAKVGLHGGSAENTSLNVGNHIHNVSGEVFPRGGGQPHGNMQPYQVCNYLIKT